MYIKLQKQTVINEDKLGAGIQCVGNRCHFIEQKEMKMLMMKRNKKTINKVKNINFCNLNLKEKRKRIRK